MNKQKILLKASSVSVILDNKHPNAMRFTGTCMVLNSDSNGVPRGVDKPVYLSVKEAEKASKTMNLMGINCLYDYWLYPDELMTDHDRRFKIGVVESCWVDGNELKFTGIIYKNDFPDIVEFIKNTVDSLGFSVEAMFNVKETDEHIEMTDVDFTGVAILYKDKAAYKNTYISEIAAKAQTGEKVMEKQEIIDIVSATVKAELEASAKAKAEAEATKELADAKAKVERLTADCSAKDELIAGKDAKIEELEKALAEKDAEIEASAKEQSIVSDVKNLETKSKLQASEKDDEFVDWASAIPTE